MPSFADFAILEDAMNKRLLIAAGAAIAHIALTQAIAYANDENVDENVGVIVVQEIWTENGYEATIIPEGAQHNPERFR
jgi:hypothetical protein